MFDRSAMSIAMLPVAFVCLIISASGALAASATGPPTFEADILPILTSRCGKCHSANTRKGGLSLSSIAALKRGGDSAEPLITDSSDDNLMWLMIEDGDMPPEGEPALSDDQKQVIHRWLESAAGKESEGADVLITQHDVLPFLYARCVVCHGGRRQEAELDLRSVESIRKGGKSGPAVVAGRSGESLLLEKIRSKDMPPPREMIRAGVRPFESSETELLAKWIDQGAREFEIAPDVQTADADSMVSNEDRDFWAFQTPTMPVVPDLAGHPDNGIEKPVDRFLLRRLIERDLGFSDQAEKRQLIRRVSFDLTGLPPKWEDVQRFTQDSSADWYAKLVDHYLDSPHYGERWGRYWLDLCGYADSEGKRSADPIRKHAWRYRDYVIRSMNEDKPYDRFLVEQIAGDELYNFENADAITDEMMDSLVATGFLRMAPDGTGSDIVDTVAERFEVVADEIEVLGSAVLGLTLRCAQCHSHKYDPIPQRDYYRLVAVFQGAYDVYDWLKPTSVPNQSKQKNPTRRFLSNVTDDEMSRWLESNRPLEEQIAAVTKELKSLEVQHQTTLFDEAMLSLSDDARTKVASQLQRDGSGLIDFSRKAPSGLTDDLKKLYELSSADLGKKVPELKKQQQATAKEISQLKSKLQEQPMVRALWDRGEPSPTWVFRRGEFTNPGDLVGPGVLSVLTDGKTPFEPAPQREGSTGRRLAFAEWLTDQKHPLTARVLVNRVWYHHFGHGIVESLSNFGRTGTPPTHPELLDWLAVSFMENGWSLKWLHREIMNTHAYRQASTLRTESEMRDPNNRWLSRMPLRRLEAEAVRDSLLAVAGELDVDRFGNPDPVTVRADGLVTSDRREDGWRRTVYVLQRRKELPTILEAFDLPQMNPNCVERPNSTVASQALHLLNNGMVRDLAFRFAEQVETDAGDDRYRQVETVYQTAFGRSPSSEEMQLALESLSSLTARWEEAEQKTGKDTPEKGSRSAASMALANFCHVVMNSAEFLFVD